jgi:hypothetical protein
MAEADGESMRPPDLKKPKLEPRLGEPYESDVMSVCVIVGGDSSDNMSMA